MKKLLLVLLLLPLLSVATPCECEYVSINYENSTITYTAPTFVETYENLNDTEFKNTLEDIEEWMQWDLINNQIKHKHYKECLKVIDNALTISNTAYTPYDEKVQGIEIYTLENIYYIVGLTIFDENNNPPITFNTLEELSTWIANKTIEDNREGYDLLLKKGKLKKYSK